MSHYFQFEADFVESLRCIPMEVRLKLDTCGIKLKLNHWHQFNLEEREKLVNLPCNTQTEINDYHDFLQNLIINKTGSPAKELIIENSPLWLNKNQIPEQVQNKAKEFNLMINLNQWQNLTDLQRFALIKLSLSGHENNNFFPALKEFNLI